MASTIERPRIGKGPRARGPAAGTHRRRGGGERGAPAARRDSRAESAAATLGPIGYLVGSPAAARVLSLFVAEPDRRFTLGELRTRAHAAKGTIQACLRTLERAELVGREGRGAATAYRYAVDRELARQMLGLVAASRRAAAPAAAESFAASMGRWVRAAEAAAGTQHLASALGAETAAPTSEAERIARLKRLPRTTVGRSAPRTEGAYAL